MGLVINNKKIICIPLMHNSIINLAMLKVHRFVYLYYKLNLVKQFSSGYKKIGSLYSG